MEKGRPFWPLIPIVTRTLTAPDALELNDELTLVGNHNAEFLTYKMCLS